MTSPIRAIVVDDEFLARANMRALLDGQGDWILVGEYDSGARALEAIRSDPPEVVFLDIRMPGLDGLQLAEALGEVEPRPVVVFATAFEEHALEAFAVEAADYLLKPIDQGRFAMTVRRLARRLRPGPLAGGAERSVAVASLATADGAQTLAVRSVGRVRLVAVEDIHWIAAAGNYVRLYLAETCHLHRSTLAALETQLPSGRFLRIHRSTLINRGEVAELRTSVAGRYQVVLKDGTELEISQRFKQRVFAALMPG